MASQDVSGKTSRLAQMQMRFQQKQQQEKEQRRIELAASKTEAETDAARSVLKTAKANNIGNGKVRQMFDERRRGAGIDRSNPLKPIAASSKSISTPALAQKPTAASRVYGVRSQEAVTAKAAPQTIRKTVPNKQAPNTRSSRSLLSPENIGERNNNAFTNDFNGDDDLDNETMPRGIYTDGDTIHNDSNNNAKKSMLNGKGSTNSPQIKLNPVLTKKSPPARATPARPVKSPQTPSAKKANATVQALKSETISLTSINKAPVSGKNQQSESSSQKTTTPRTPKSPKQPPPAEAPPEGMVACKICGRNFNEDRIAKHETVCQKMANSKRKVYDATKHRIQGTEVEQYFKKKPTSRGGQRSANYTSTAAATGQKIAPKKSNWRKKHEEFITAIRAAKQVQAHLARGGKLSDLPPPPPSENPDYVQCPHCSRRFNQSAAERHIPRCATMLHNKPKRK